MSKVYLARFKQGSGLMDSNFIDYSKDGNSIIKHEWAMGGETKSKVKSVPSSISGYIKLEQNHE